MPCGGVQSTFSVLEASEVKFPALRGFVLPTDIHVSRGTRLHDGRLPLQVLGDIGVVDLVKRHHLWSHLLVQNDVVVVGQEHVSK